MKSVVIALLLIAVLLFVAAEAKRRGGKGKPGGKPDGGRKIKECPKNCSDCVEGICRECDDDFALKTRRDDKTICVPCEGPGKRRLKKKHPDVFLEECTECPKNCSSCGENGNCEICDDGFFKVQTRLLNRTICVSCSRKMKRKWPEVYKEECTQNACGRKCANCTMDGICIECEGDLRLFTSPHSNFTKCVKKCPLFYKLEKGSSPARCEVKQGKRKCGKYCEECTEANVCTKCKEGLDLITQKGIGLVCKRKLRKGQKKNMSPDLP